MAQFAGTPAAKPKSDTDAFWSQHYADASTPGAALNGGFYGGTIAHAGEAGRAINEGSSINPEMANAGGGDQFALVNAEKNAGRVKLAGGEGEEVGKTATAVAGEGGRYTLGRARSTDQFNLGKAGEESKALAGGSHYQVSPWLGVIQGLVSGAASSLGGLGGGDDPEGSTGALGPGGGGIPDYGAPGGAPDEWVPPPHDLTDYTGP